MLYIDQFRILRELNFSSETGFSVLRSKSRFNDTFVSRSDHRDV